MLNPKARIRAVLRTALSVANPASLFRWAIALAPIGSVGTPARATDYYINSNAGSDSNPGTSSSSPWVTFANVNSHTFVPGDTINLATGSTWNQELDLYGGGSATGGVVTVQPYGPNSNGNYSTGPTAKISRNSTLGDKCIYLHNPNYWSILGIEMCNADRALYILSDHNTQNNSTLHISKCYFHDCSVNTTAVPNDQSGGVYLAAFYSADNAYYITDFSIQENYFVNCTGAFVTLVTQIPSALRATVISCNYVANQLGASSVTSGDCLLQDNLFSNCATVAEPAGNTVIFTQWNEGAQFINNYWNTVPDEGTYDQTCVDEEDNDDNQAYYGNVFWNTAGPGVECLTIHGLGSNNTQSLLDGNLFYENGAHSPLPGAVASYNVGTETETGVLSNNLYFDPASEFLYASGPATWAQNNNLAITNTTNLYNGAVNYGFAQGDSQWSYELWTPSGGWSTLSGAYNNTDYAWPLWQWGGDGQTDGWVTRFDECAPSNSSNWIARVWTAPQAGTVSIRGFVQSEFFANQAPSSGVVVAIAKATVGNTIWPGPGGKQAINGPGVATNLDGVEVAAGDQLYFEVNNNGAGNNTNDAVSWVPSIYYTSSSASVGPTIASQPKSQTASAGETVTFSVGTSGSHSGLTFQWFENGSPLADGNGISGSNAANLVLSGAATQPGSYTCAVTNSAGSVSSAPANLSVATTNDLGRLINISCRAQVGTGGNVLIAGFVVGGPGTSGSESVLVRGSGPALIPFGVTGTLSDPQLQINSGSTVLGINDGWAGTAQIANTSASVGAFTWINSTSHDSALLETLPSGPYTAEISGQSGDTGVALVEVYDATPNGSYTPVSPRLVNISARVQVGKGASSLIAGFVIGGSTSRTVLIRGSGPALIPFGVSGTLPDPQLQLYQGNGDGTSTLLQSNTGWGGDAQIAAVAGSVGAFSWGPLATPDSAILVTLPPGAYTVQVSGASGDTGIALVEVYEVQ